MGGIIKTPCPDCGGQIHHEVFVGSNRNPTSYSKYDCIGDRELYIGYDAASLVNSGRGCNFHAEIKKNKETGEIIKKNVRSSNLDSWESWKQYDNKHKEQ